MEPLLECLRRLENLDRARDCFPYQILRPRCPVAVFFDFYGVPRPNNSALLGSS